MKTQSNRCNLSVLVALAALATVLAAGLTHAQQRSRPQTLQVPSDRFPTIQSAINFAAAGDRIFIAPGVYNETLTIAKRITLKGSGARGGSGGRRSSGHGPPKLCPSSGQSVWLIISRAGEAKLKAC